MNPDTPETKVCLVCHGYHVYILYKNPTDSYCSFWCVKLESVSKSLTMSVVTTRDCLKVLN